MLCSVLCYFEIFEMAVDFNKENIKSDSHFFTSQLNFISYTGFVM